MDLSTFRYICSPSSFVLFIPCFSPILPGSIFRWYHPSFYSSLLICAVKAATRCIHTLIKLVFTHELNILPRHSESIRALQLRPFPLTVYDLRVFFVIFFFRGKGGWLVALIYILYVYLSIRHLRASDHDENDTG